MAGAAAFTQMMADATPMGLQADASAPMTLSWPEPLRPVMGQQMTRVNTLYRSADVHNRVLRMADLFFTRSQMNELKQMIGMAVGGGRYVEPTWTLAEGQAIMATPGFDDKMQREGIAAFYDYVFTIDWLMHRIETLESLLAVLGDTKRSSPDEIRFLQSQLDSVLMSPHGMPWYMWEREGVQSLTTPDPKGNNDALVAFAAPYLRLLTGQSKPGKTSLDTYAKAVQDGKAFDGTTTLTITRDPSLDARVFWDTNFLLVCLAAQEAVLLSSPLWNDLVAIGQGLYRVQLTRKATTELGVLTGAKGGVPIEPGAWINTFRQGQTFWNVFPSDDATNDRGDTQLVDSFDFVPKNNTVETIPAWGTAKGTGCVWQVSNFIEVEKTTSTLNEKSLAAVFAKASATRTPETLKSWPSANTDTDDTSISSQTQATTKPLQSDEQSIAAFLQPKIKDCGIYAAAGLALYFNDSDLEALERETKEATTASDYMRRRASTHAGSGGAIGSYVCTGAGARAALFFDPVQTGSSPPTPPPMVLRVTSKMMEACIKRMPEGHPTKWMPKLWECMQKAVTYDAAEVKRQQLDPSVRMDRPPRSLIDYARSRIKDLEVRYGAMRNGRASLPLHPLATAGDLFSPEFSTSGVMATHRAVPQCPVGTVPMIFDAVRNKPLSTQEWQRMVVDVNGQKMLPDTLEVRGCLPGRPLAAVMSHKP